VTNIMRTHLPRSQQAVAAVPPCALRSLLVLQPQGGRQSRTYMIHCAPRIRTGTASAVLVDVKTTASCSGCFPVPRIGARAAAAGPPRRPTQARGPENSGINFE
jgi:hypothetical protein